MSTQQQTTSTEHSTEANSACEVEMFYDGACPLCLRESRLLQKMDRQDKIRFINIAAADFSASAVGKTHYELMSEMHGRLPDGTWVTGVEAFRQFYSAVGFGWLMKLTRLPGIRQLLDAGYRLFARYRLQITGRCIDCCPGTSEVSLESQESSAASAKGVPAELAVPETSRSTVS